MALSEEEQRLLEQMEKALAADDPKLANTMRGDQTPRVLRRKQAALAGLGFLAGTILLIAGVAINGGAHWYLSVVGFVAMVASTVAALSAYQPAGDQPSKPRSGNGGGNGGGDAFMNKMEERWRRRQGDGH